LVLKGAFEDEEALEVFSGKEEASEASLILFLPMMKMGVSCSNEPWMCKTRSKETLFFLYNLQPQKVLERGIE